MSRAVDHAEAADWNPREPESFVMGDGGRFLSDLVPRPWSAGAGHGFQPAGLFIGKGASAIEVAVARASRVPLRTALLESWRARRGRRVAPVLLVVLYPGGAALCGASGEEPPTWTRDDARWRRIVELAGRIASLYGLEEVQLVHVFDTFHEGWDYQARPYGVLRHFRAWRHR